MVIYQIINILFLRFMSHISWHCIRVIIVELEFKIITARIRRMREGNIFSLSTLMRREYSPPGDGGVPHPRSGWGVPHPRSGWEGTPFQVWMAGTPLPGLDGDNPPPLLGLDAGTPPPIHRETEQHSEHLLRGG